MKTSIQVTQHIAGHELYVVAHYIPREELWAVMGKRDREITFATQTDRPWDEIMCFLDEAVADFVSQPSDAD